MTDNAPELFFGLGNAQKIKSTTITWATGEQEIIENPRLNTKISVKKQ
jgi:hypothetical protein